MKKLAPLFICILFAQQINAQQNNDQYLHHVRTLDNILQTLYNVISGEKGEERNWELFKFLFKPEAKLIPSGKSKEDLYNVKYMSADDYINTSGQWLVNNGFFEKEIHRSVDIFGNIAHVFSSYESFKSKSDTIPFMRGINSIQLLNDGNRWWIINIYWTQETEENPIPSQYIKN